MFCNIKITKKEGIGAYPEASSTKTATRMANKTIDSPLYTQKKKRYENEVYQRT